MVHLDAVLEAVEFPTGIADLNPGLTDVDRDALPHFLFSPRCLDGKKIAIKEKGEKKKK